MVKKLVVLSGIVLLTAPAFAEEASNFEIPQKEEAPALINEKTANPVEADQSLQKLLEEIAKPVTAELTISELKEKFKKILHHVLSPEQPVRSPRNVANLKGARAAILNQCGSPECQTAFVYALVEIFEQNQLNEAEFKAAIDAHSFNAILH
jgi:hypothetical protein